MYSNFSVALCGISLVVYCVARLNDCPCSTLQHEIGHGCAAYGEGVPVNGFGALLLAYAVPGAFVRLCSSLQLQPTLSQLRVYFGGVWNNIVSAAVLRIVTW